MGGGCVEVREVGLIHADPPYGVKERMKRHSAGRSNRPNRPRVKARDWPTMTGDDQPFEPAPLLALRRPTVLWGANHYHDKLPPSPSMILWDKRRDVTPDDNADGELAWSNLGGPLRIFRHLWRAICRESEVGSPLAPTQKPIALSTYIFQRARLKPGALVFVPFLGSGPDLPAALAMGLRVVACDVSEECCRVAVGARLGAVARGRAQEPVGPLFGAGTREAAK